MFASGPNYNKLKANLQLAIQRLKLMEKKKTEMAIKSRREIADYLAANKPDRARIRVETIIREENTVEAMELLEMFCDLLVARAGLMKAQAQVDPGLEEAVCSLIWAAPRMEAEIQELRVIAEQLRMKYGRDYFEAAACNSLQKVNPKLLKKMAVEPPERRIVELYLVEIARSFNVPFTPDNTAMAVPTAPLVIDGVVVPSPPPGPGVVVPVNLLSVQPIPSQPLPPNSQVQAPVDSSAAPPPNIQPQQYQPPNMPLPPHGHDGIPSNYQPYPGSASAPMFTTLPPPYQASNEGSNKALPPGWASAADANVKPPLPNDALNPGNIYPTGVHDNRSDFDLAGLPSVPSSGQSPSENAQNSNDATSQLPLPRPPVDDTSLDDLEARFEELRRKK